MGYTQPQPALPMVSGTWRVTIFRGIAAVLFGLAALSFWQGMAFLFIGGPLAVLFDSWPIALGQDLRALADVAEYVQRQQSGLG